jgi:hypothetical protein
MGAEILREASRSSASALTRLSKRPPAWFSCGDCVMVHLHNAYDDKDEAKALQTES